MDEVINELKMLETYHLEVGIKYGGEMMVKIANVQEYGADITPKKGKFLTIPSIRAIKLAKTKGVDCTVRDLEDEGVKMFRPKGKRVICMTTPKQKKLVVLFYLMTHVHVPERSYFRSTANAKQNKWVDYFGRQIEKVANGDLTAKQAWSKFGDIIVRDIQHQIRAIKEPGNAAVTKENKGSSNPLIDTGELLRSIGYEVI